jgi:hypothetical protein
MPIIFISPEKRKRQLSAFLMGFVGLLMVIIVWRVFLVKPKVPVDYKEIYKFPEIKIDFDFLDSEKIQKLQLPEEMPSPKRVGRTNPFIIYSPEEISIEEEILEGATSSPIQTPTL